MKSCVVVLSIQKVKNIFFKSAESAAKCTDRKPENVSGSEKRYIFHTFVHLRCQSSTMLFFGIAIAHFIHETY